MVRHGRLVYAEYVAEYGESSLVGGFCQHVTPLLSLW